MVALMPGRDYRNTRVLGNDSHVNMCARGQVKSRR